MLLRGGRVVDPSQNLDALRDVRIAGGLIAEIGEHLAPEANEESSMRRARSSLRLHRHARAPARARIPRERDDRDRSGGGFRGGFTAVACMPNTNPPIDAPSVVADVLEFGRAPAFCARLSDSRRHPGARGPRARDFAALAAAGAVAFSDDGDTIADARVLRDAALRSAGVAGVFISHCEDARLKGNAVMNDGAVSRAMGATGSPAVAKT